MGKEIHYEQAVYGSFPFWHRGYAVLARSAGCRAEWLDALRMAGQRFGERPTGVAEKASLFALPLRGGPWMIVGVFPQGCDDQCRPGALAFHGLFVGRWAYRRAGANPFVFAPVLRPVWAEKDQDVLLTAGSLILLAQEPEPEREAIGRIETIVGAMKRGQRVVLPSAEPIEDLASAVWRRLPGRVRRRASLATWAFSNANRFDLVAVPRLADITPDPSELVLEPDSVKEAKDQPESVPEPPAAPPGPGRRWTKRTVAALFICLAGVTAIAAGLCWWSFPRSQRPADPRSLSRPEPRPPETGSQVHQVSSPPKKFAERVLTPDERRRLTEALVDIVDRFSPRGSESQAPDGSRNRPGPKAQELVPAELMIRLAKRLRYRGRWLSTEELEGLTRSTEGSRPRPISDAALALRWNQLTRRFADDRPLPADFVQGTPRWQLATLAWSFHVDDEPGVVQALDRGAPEEVIHALADVLTVNAPLPATSLSIRYPALEDYREFLGALPRR